MDSFAILRISQVWLRIYIYDWVCRKLCNVIRIDIIYIWVTSLKVSFTTHWIDKRTLTTILFTAWHYQYTSLDWELPIPSSILSLRVQCMLIIHLFIYLHIYAVNFCEGLSLSTVYRPMHLYCVEIIARESCIWLVLGLAIWRFLASWWHCHFQKFYLRTKRYLECFFGYSFHPIFLNCFWYGQHPGSHLVCAQCGNWPCFNFDRYPKFSILRYGNVYQ